jgi:hypothetical protein
MFPVVVSLPSIFVQNGLQNVNMETDPFRWDLSRDVKLITPDTTTGFTH